MTWLTGVSNLRAFIPHPECPTCKYGDEWHSGGILPHGRKPENKGAMVVQPRGFTLVEIMISVLILGVGLTSVANSYILALRGANSTQNNITALILAKEKFENLELASLKGTLPSSQLAEIIRSSTKDYSYQQEITQITEPADLTKYLVSACLAISWPDKNSSKNVTLATYLLK